MSNGRFAIAVHILTLLEKEQGDVTTSDYLAGSININPVLVRKELSNLRKHGLVESKEGKSGGFSLGKPARQILLSDVYEAVRQSSILGQSRNSPNPHCPVGRQINGHLEDIYAEAEDAVMKRLGKITLAEFVKKFE